MRYNECSKCMSSFSNIVLTKIILRNAPNCKVRKKAERILKSRKVIDIYLSAESKLVLEKEKDMKAGGICFGHKSEAYFTEEEMINGFVWKHEDLSKEEKLLYINTGNYDIN